MDAESADRLLVPATFQASDSVCRAFSHHAGEAVLGKLVVKDEILRKGSSGILVATKQVTYAESVAGCAAGRGLP